MKRRNIQRVIREKLNNYLSSITDTVLVDKMKKDILVTGGFYLARIVVLMHDVNICVA